MVTPLSPEPDSHPAPRTTPGPLYTGKHRQLPVGHRLRTLRAESGLSMRALSALTKAQDPSGKGISLATITRLENNQHLPARSSLELLALVFSEKLGRTIQAEQLAGEDNPRLALINYLEMIRQRQQMDDTAFYGRLLGIGPRVLDQFRSGRRLPHTKRLGAIMTIIPESVPLVVAAMQHTTPTVPLS